MARGDDHSKIFFPVFNSATLFPPLNTPDFKPNSKSPCVQPRVVKLVMRRFTFTSSTIDDLKQQVSKLSSIAKPSRVEVLSAFLWSRLMAAKGREKSGKSIACHPVSLRGKFQICRKIVWLWSVIAEVNEKDMMSIVCFTVLKTRDYIHVEQQNPFNDSKICVAQEMAYAALVSLSQAILQYDDGDQSSVFLSEKHRIRSLHDHVVFLQSFLEEKSADKFEARIRDTAYEAEDIIDYIKLSQIQSSKSRPRGPGLGKFKCFSFISEHVKNRHHQYDIRKLYKLRKVRHTFDSIVGEVMAIKNSLKSGDVELISDSPTASSLSRQVRDKVSMVGFDENLNTIKDLLCRQSSKLQVIPILGMGGIGKTTLAINAYQDPLTMERFDIRAWVTVSQDYSIKRILSELLVSMGTLNKKESDKSNETMDVRVYKSLKGRRYLVVIDDIWSTNVWDELRRLLPDDNNGSRIMLTTRLSDVAGYAHGSSSSSSSSSSYLHEIQLMDVDQSWHLLSQNVFRQEQCPQELEDIGRMIAKHCRGLPLAIIVIAGVLRSVSRTRASWKNVAENVNSAVTMNEEQFANILSLSYTHLPHHLRPCFLYMGGFPEDYEIHVSKLIKLWTAEGFIKSSGSKSYEESAEEYLEDLVKRSLILVAERKSNGKIKSCNVHDLVRDLCIKKAQEEKFLLNLMSRDVNGTHDQRRVSANDNRDLRYYDSPLRTILWLSSWYQLHKECLGNFRLLRVLDARDITLGRDKFPTEILELIFLRYLALSFPLTFEVEIPASISRLGNLETLIIRPMNQYKRERYKVQFPLEIWGMTQLRHLLLYTLDILPDPCHGHPALQNLQTLTKVKAFKCTERILQMIPNLEKLGIMYQERCLSDFQLENLVYLHQLKKLNICVHHSICISFGGHIGFPEMLEKLTLEGLLIDFQVMKMIGLLLDLQVLKLESCRFEESKWETNKGQFPQLNFLQITTTHLEDWIIAESGHFPRLKRLMLLHCPSLVEIPDVIGDIPTLELIEVSEWNINLVESAKRMQEEQQSDGNDTFQLLIHKY